MKFDDSDRFVQWPESGPILRAVGFLPRIGQRIAALHEDWKCLLLDIVFAPLLFVALLVPQRCGEIQNLDYSWMRSLAHFMIHRSQAGVDYVFTYGPLGFFLTTMYEPSLYWAKYAWSLGLATALTIITVATVRRIPTLDQRALLYVLWIVFGTIIYDVTVALGILQITLLLFVNERKGPIYYFGPVFLAVMSLVKFTFAINAIVALLLLSASRLIERRNNAAWTPWAIYLGALATLWVALGQRIGHLPRFVRESMEIASGFSAAMGLEAVHPTFSGSLAVAALGVMIGVIAALQRPRRATASAFMVYALFALFVSWKHGMVRDDVHVLNFFDFAVVFPFVIVALAPRILQLSTVRAALVVSLIVAIHAHYVEMKQTFDPKQLLVDTYYRLKKHAGDFRHPRRMHRLLAQAHRNATDAWQLPLIKAQVGDETIDVFSVDQSLLFVNHLTWHPRPIFQSYAAYTPRLVAANTKFYQSNHAPKFVLFSMLAIDNHFPALEDSGVLLELIKNYRPVLSEKSWLLLERRAKERLFSSEEDAPVASVERIIRFGENVAVAAKDGEYQTVALDIQPTFFGKLKTFCYRTRLVHLNVTTNLGGKTTYRIIPSISGQPFLLNPIIASNSSLLKLSSDRTGEYVTAFSVTTPGADQSKSFAPEIKLSLQSFRMPHEPAVESARATWSRP